MLHSHMDYPTDLQYQAHLLGVIWEEKTFGLEPKWVREPDQEAIQETISSLYPSSASPEVSFLAQGAFNKIYNIRINDEDLTVRVTLPVNPAYKTFSEVATLKWIDAVTSIPAPKVIAYNGKGKDAIDFEWILMNKLPGKPLSDCCRSIPLAAKIRLVRQLAAHSAALFQHQLRSIGNLYGEKTSHGANSSFIGRVVSMHFFWGERVHMNVFRGPFRWSNHWMRARLYISEEECKATLG
jgi:Phosphotransferase enzyme family